MELLLTRAIISGLMLGMVYAMIGVGMNIIYGVMKIVNFAYGDFLMLGAYFAYWLNTLLGWNPFISLLITVPVFFLIGVAIFYITVPRLLKSKEPELASYLAYFGVSLIISTGALIAWGAEPRGIMPPFKVASVKVGPFYLPTGRLITFILCLITVLMLTYLLYRTYIGKAVRATIQNREAVQLLGVDVNKVSALSFGIGMSLAGIVGVLNTMVFPAIYPHMGVYYTVIAFTVIVLGGLGNPIAGIVGGLILGLVESVSMSFLPAAFSLAIAFIILIIVIMIKPQGLMARS